MSNRMVFHCGEVVLAEGVMHDGTVVVENRFISEVVHSQEYKRENDDTVIECAGNYICPGFIDLHNQGGGGFSVMDASPESINGLARTHAAHGTTGLLLTPPVVEDSYRNLLPGLAKTIGSDTGGAAIIGIHCEGPFLNPVKAGCMPSAGMREPDGNVLEEILDLCDGTVMEMTIAPELPGALDLILTLAKRGVVSSLGHSNASLTDVLRAIDHGASHVTHFFNAMSPIHHREPGLTGAALYSNDLSVEIIADGYHVHPWMMGLAVQNKGVGLTCLVTDSMHVSGFGDGEYESLGLNVKLENGRLSLADDPDTLAGSVLTMDRAVGNIVNMLGLSIADAVSMASTSPAAVLGLENSKGRLEPGYDADITVLDSTFNTGLTVVNGRVVYDKQV